MFILTISVFFIFNINFSVEDDWTGDDTGGTLNGGAGQVL